MNNTWTEFLSHQGAVLADGAVSFPTPPAADTALVPLAHLALIRATGEDAAPFLHNLFSNDVQKLAADAAQWNSFNSPKGRMLASFLIWRDAADYLLALSADIQPAMQRKLGMYVLRSKVKLSAPEDLVLLGVCGSRAASLLAGVLPALPTADMASAAVPGGRVIRLDATRYVLALEAAAASAAFTALQAAGAAPAGTEAWQLAMIRAGQPLVSQPVQEEFVPQMLNFDLIGGISFNKGCYPGQEVVARTRYLGKIKKRMYRVALPAGSAPAVGSDLYSAEFGEQSAGKLVNVAPAGDGFEALAVLQTSSAEGGQVHLGSPAGPQLSFLDLPYGLE